MTLSRTARRTAVVLGALAALAACGSSGGGPSSTSAASTSAATTSAAQPGCTAAHYTEPSAYQGGSATPPPVTQSDVEAFAQQQLGNIHGPPPPTVTSCSATLVPRTAVAPFLNGASTTPMVWVVVFHDVQAAASGQPVPNASGANTVVLVSNAHPVQAYAISTYNGPLPSALAAP